MKLPDTVKVDNFFTGKIISLTVEEVNHGTPDATIEVDNPESIEFFA